MMKKKTILITLLLLCLAGFSQAQPVMPTGTTALECLNTPGRFVTARDSGQDVRMNADTGDDPEGQFTIVPALTGTPGNVSFLSVSLPDNYLRHVGHVLRYSTITDDIGKADASWTPVPGLADPTNPRYVSFKSENFGWENRHMMADNSGNRRSLRSTPITAATTQAELERATFIFLDKTLATSPQPENGDDEVSLDVGGISWKAGEGVATHNVFFGTDQASVANATIADPMGTTVYPDIALDQNSIPLSRREYDTTYYWRVDEVPGTGAGLVWSFKTELRSYPLPTSSIIGVATAGEPGYPGEQEPNSTYTGLGLDANDMHSSDHLTMWLVQGTSGETWIQYEFDKVYMLYDMLIWNYNQDSGGADFSAKDVNISYSLNATDWTTLPTVTLSLAPGDNTCTAETVALNDAIAKYVRITFLSSYYDIEIYGLSEVLFSYEPTRAVQLAPNNDATNQVLNVNLRWKPGRYVDEHYLYISTEINDVNGILPLVDPIKLTDANYVPGFDLATKYYWRVDEVNMANAFTTWDGSVRSLTTASSRVIDGFETHYQDNDANAVWVTWTGWEDNTNGGSMGNPGVPYLSEDDEHGGDYCAPMYYDNTGTTKPGVTNSWVSAQSIDLPIGTSNWSTGSPSALVIWFRGDPNNELTDQLYVKLNSTKNVYDGPVADITRTAWTRWEVPLADINLNSITSITIGVERIGATGGSGVLYLDDIQLTVASAEATDPGISNLVAKYNMENNLQDSSGSGFNGTGNGNLAYEAGRDGMALVFDGNNATYVDLPIGEKISTMESCTISTWVNYAGGNAWQRIYDFGTSTTNYMFMTPDQGTTYRAVLLVNGNGEDIASATELATGNWEHVAAVYDAENSTLKLYLNGILVGTDTTMRYAVKDLGVTTQNYLGKSQWPDPNFRGKLDDFRIYDRALSDGEVKYIYKN